MRSFLVTLKYKWLVFYYKHEAEVWGTFQAICWGIVLPAFCDVPVWFGILFGVILTAFAWISAPIFRKQERKRQIREFLKEQEENERNH